MSQPETWEPGIAKFEPANCLECGARVNAAAAPEHPGALPNPGDFCLCSHCGAVMVFGADRQPRPFTTQEAEETLADAETMNDLARHVARVHLFRAKPASPRPQ